MMPMQKRVPTPKIDIINALILNGGRKRGTIRANTVTVMRQKKRSEMAMEPNLT
jgi:hypothetical protein